MVIGAGYIGLELGSVWARLGAEVTVVEYLKRILPGTDGEIARVALQLFKRQGLDLQLGSRVTGARDQGQEGRGAHRGQQPLTADRVLVAVGRKPGPRGWAWTPPASNWTSAVSSGRRPQPGRRRRLGHGDVAGGAMLAHKATDEAVACVERLAGQAATSIPALVPGVCYTDPEIAGVGRTEEQLKEAKVPYSKGVYTFRSNGRALALDRLDGRVKVLAHKETDRVLGVHIVGPRAGDLIAEATAAMAFGASAEDIGAGVPCAPDAVGGAARSRSRGVRSAPAWIVQV